MLRKCGVMGVFRGDCSVRCGGYRKGGLVLDGRLTLIRFGIEEALATFGRSDPLTMANVFSI